jgi:putative flippase GtrA
MASVSLLRAKVRMLLASDALGLKALRFGFVGALSGLVFAVTTTILTGWIGMNPNLASVVGYLASMPLNFCGNRRFAFRSENILSEDLFRFALLHAGNILITVFAMEVVSDLLKLHYEFGIIGSIAAVPCVSFFAMNWWVFGKAIGRPRPGPKIIEDSLKA